MTITISTVGETVRVEERREGAPAYRITAAGVRLVNTDRGRIIGTSEDQPAIRMEVGGVIVNEVGGIIRSFDTFPRPIVIRGSPEADDVRNFGLIVGNVALLDGDDLFVQSPAQSTSFELSVNLGGGNDRYLLFSLPGQSHSIDANGGDGFDTLVIQGRPEELNGNYSGALVSRFERLEFVDVGGNLVGFSNFQQISIVSTSMSDFPGTVGLVDSSNPLADIQMDGGRLGLRGASSARNVIGSDRVEAVELASFGAIPARLFGSVQLGGGDDEFWYTAFSNTVPLPVIDGFVDGGAGTDTLRISVDSALTLNLGVFRGFERLDTGAFSSATSFLRLENASELQEITADSGGRLTIAKSNLPNAAVNVSSRGMLVLEETATIGRYGFPNRPFFESVFDQNQQADDRLSVTVINNGTILGAVQLYYGDDLYDGRQGTAGGTIFGYAGNDRLYGGLNDDRIEGGFGADDLFGGGGIDMLLGGSGSDRLDGGIGNDSLDGGLGRDVALYAISRAGATIVRNANGVFTVNAGSEGIDTLTGIEQIQFGNTLFALTRFDSSATVRISNFTSGAGGWTTQDRVPRQMADVNGDGLADIVGFGQSGTQVSFATVDGAFALPIVAIANFGGDQGWSSDNIFRRELADVNGDGRDDIVGFGTFGVLVALAQANGTFAAPSLGSTNFNPANGWLSQNGFARSLADVNGDGFADIVGFGVPGTFVALADGRGGFGTASFALANFGVNQGWTSNNQFHREVGDVNGDGRADIVGFGTFGTLVALGQANGTFAAPVLALNDFGTSQGWSSQDVFSRDLADVDGDGRDDVVGFGIAGTFVAYGRADGMFSPAAFELAAFGRDQGWTSDNITRRELADVNGDGRADIVGFSNAGVIAAIAFDGLVL